ncbi:hypothetical protein [Fibrobacter sp. UWEL]|uniref:hypothetical protein n=1 Tax=Fibrobacter sp. UWEL TaxID=1896209 RepID=UPI000923ABD4|nr:hypothetical protein [Fibrobacter sp. UWEL]SHL49181.1 hypothetical protein SAMN05720468_1345 [Fibrobacter sp. UWEL]
MIEYKKIQEFLEERKQIPENWDDGNQIYWDKFSNYLVTDIQSAIKVLETECTPEDISWICEVFDDVARKSQSKEFIAAIHRIHDKMPDDVQKNIEIDIEYAEAEIIDRK